MRTCLAGFKHSPLTWDAPQNWRPSLHLTPQSTSLCYHRARLSCQMTWHFSQKWLGRATLQAPATKSHGFVLQSQGGTQHTVILLPRDVEHSPPAAGTDHTPLLERQGSAVVPPEDPEGGAQPQAVVAPGAGAAPEQVLQIQAPVAPGGPDQAGAAPPVHALEQVRGVWAGLTAGTAARVEHVPRACGARVVLPCVSNFCLSFPGDREALPARD